MKKEIILENENIKVETTGHDYDFIAYVENKTDNDITIVLDSEDEIKIKANDWIGLFADENGYWQLNQFKNNNFEIFIGGNHYEHL